MRGRKPAPEADSSTQTQRELEFKAPVPKVRLYAMLTDWHLSIETSSKLARDLGWGVTFVSDKEASMRQRAIIPLPLSTVKKLMRRCKHHWYLGAHYKSWRNHPSGFDGKGTTAIIESDGLLKIITGNI
jgi:hypothetical protein